MEFQHSYPTHEEIALCAYLIWESEGCPVDRDLDHWFQAEHQLYASRVLDDEARGTGRNSNR
jgi:hypothetical protein